MVILDTEFIDNHLTMITIVTLVPDKHQLLRPLPSAYSRMWSYRLHSASDRETQVRRISVVGVAYETTALMPMFKKFVQPAAKFEPWYFEIVKTIVFKQAMVTNTSTGHLMIFFSFVVAS